MTQINTSPQDTAGSYLSPGGSNGGVLAGAPSALQILDACDRLRDFRYLQRWVGVWLTYCSNRCADCDKYGSDDEAAK